MEGKFIKHEEKWFISCNQGVLYPVNAKLGSKFFNKIVEFDVINSKITYLKINND